MADFTATDTYVSSLTTAAANEVINLVLKKALGMPNTKPRDYNSLTSELPVPSRFAVYTSQIYSQTVPSDANAISTATGLGASDFNWAVDTTSALGISLSSMGAERATSATWPQIVRYRNITLASSQGSRDAFYDANNNLLVGALPAQLSNYYLATVQDQSGNFINAATSPYIIDGDAGILTFYANTVPPVSVDVNKPPTVTLMYRYEGTRGLGGANIWNEDASGNVYYNPASWSTVGVSIGKYPPQAGASLDVSGTVFATYMQATNFKTLSDARLKTDLQPVLGSSGQSPLEALRSLSAYRYKLLPGEMTGATDASPHEIGFLAQDVEAVLPEVVSTWQGGHKALMYDRLTAVLVEAVKAQSNTLDEHAALIAALQADKAAASPTTP
jgi:hypothetical protein